MKFSIEIKDDECKYSYKLGMTEETGNMSAHADLFLLVCECVKLFNQSKSRESSYRMNDVLAHTWVAEDIERSQAIIDGIKNKRNK